MVVIRAGSIIAAFALLVWLAFELAASSGEPEGRATIRGAAVDVLSTVRDASEAPIRAEDASSTRGGSVRGLELRVASGARVEGTVRNAGGEPLQGAVVHVASTVLGGAIVAQPVRTDREGRYAFTGLAAGRFDVTARYLESCGAVAVELQEGELRRGVDIVCAADATQTQTITGRVRDASGAGLRFFSVTAAQDGRRVNGMARTDSLGKFVIEGLAPGDYRVRATWDRAPVFAGASPWVTWGPTQTELVRAGSRDVELISQKEPHGSIRGRLRVVGSAELPDKLTVVLRGKALRLGIVDIVAGAFELAEVSPGDYSLGIEGKFEKVEVQVSVGAGLVTDVGTIELRPPGLISGRVLDTRGLPFAGASVYVNVGYFPGFSKRPFVQRSAVTDEHGRFECRGLRSDGAHFLVWTEGYAPIQFFLGPGAASRGLELRLARAGTIRLLHLPTEGRNELSLTVSLSPSDPPSAYGSYATKRLLDGANQRYAKLSPSVDFRDLPPGRYEISVISGPGRIVTLGEGELLQVDWRKK